MVSRDSRGEIDENIRWKSQIITQANSVGAISVLVDKLTSQVEAGRGWSIASPAETVTWYSAQLNQKLERRQQLACTTDETKTLELRLSPSEKQHPNPCSWPPPGPVKKAIVDWPIRKKRNSKRISGKFT